MARTPGTPSSWPPPKPGDVPDGQEVVEGAGVVKNVGGPEPEELVRVTRPIEQAKPEKVVDSGVEDEERALKSAAEANAALEANRDSEVEDNNGKRRAAYEAARAKVPPPPTPEEIAEAAAVAHRAANGTGTWDSSTHTGIKPKEPKPKKKKKASQTEAAPEGEAVSAKDMTPAEKQSALRNAVHSAVAKFGISPGLARREAGVVPLPESKPEPEKTTEKTLREQVEEAKGPVGAKFNEKMPPGGTPEERAAAKAIGEGLRGNEAFKNYFAGRSAEQDKKISGLMGARAKGVLGALGTVGGAIGSVFLHPVKTFGKVKEGGRAYLKDIATFGKAVGWTIGHGSEALHRTGEGLKNLSERYKAYSSHLNERNIHGTKRLRELLGAGAEKIVDGYQALPMRYKFLMTAGIVGGLTFATGGAALGSLTGMLGVQRAVAGATLSRQHRASLEKALAESEKEGTESVAAKWAAMIQKMSPEEQKSYYRSVAVTYFLGSSAATLAGAAEAHHLIGSEAGHETVASAPHAEVSHADTTTQAGSETVPSATQAGAHISPGGAHDAVSPGATSSAHANIQSPGASGGTEHGIPTPTPRPDAPHVSAEHSSQHEVHHAAQPSHDFINWREHEETRFLNSYRLEHGQMPSSGEINTHLSEEWSKLHPNSELPYGVHPDHPPVPIPRPEAHNAPVAEAPSQPLAAEHMTPPQPPVPAAVPTPPHPEIPVPTPPVHAPEVLMPTPPVPHPEAVPVPPVHAPEVPVPPAPPAPEAVPVPPLAEPAVSAPHHLQPESSAGTHAQGSAETQPQPPPAPEAGHTPLNIDLNAAARYADAAGNKIVYGGSLQERISAASGWVNGDHSAVVYFDFTTPRLGGILPDLHHVGRAYWDTDSNSLTVENAVLNPQLRGLHVPGVQDLVTKLPEKP